MTILNLSIIFFTNILKLFFIYIKMTKYLSAKYYLENKERLQKKAHKILKSF